MSRTKQRPIARLAAVLVAALLAITIAPSSPADAALRLKRWTPPSAQEGIYTVPKDTLKKGQTAAHYKFKTTFGKAIQAAPKGATITVVSWAVFYRSIADKLIAAYRRGVHVQLTTWDHGTKKDFPVVKRLKDALGVNAYSSSYIKVCVGSCSVRGKDDGAEHGKIAMVSRIINRRGKPVKYLWFVGSENLTDAPAWNHTELVVGYKALYDGLRDYADSLKENRTYRRYAPVSDGPYTVWFYPSRQASNPVYAALQKATPKHKLARNVCTVRVMMYMWSSGMAHIARQLGKLKKMRCDVSVIISHGSTDRKIIRLLKKLKVPVWDARTKHHFLHTKMTVISTVVKGKKVRDVWTGSLNFIRKMDVNNEILLRIKSAVETARAFKFFDQVVDHSHKA